MGCDHTDDYVWHEDGGDCDEATEVETTELNEAEATGGDVTGWVKSYYLDTWEFVTACFTEQGCQDYIDANVYNLDEPRIYVASAYRNCEFIAVREMLKAQPSKEDGLK
ncbi:unnamed protein product [marine sediment metagenome]|uniref:Uncharacterized protein n=1 Tax=marine sediment metagenome TaxID=412755 RepID=X0Y211_9ZZZZ